MPPSSAAKRRSIARTSRRARRGNWPAYAVAELLDVEGHALSKLYEARTSSPAPLDPSAEGSGDMPANRWGIVQNVDTATLINAITT
jgi:hypothetical protein